MRPFPAEFGDPGGIGLSEAIAEFFELAITHFHIPRGLNGTPSLLKLGAVDLGEMVFGIALHLNYAQNCPVSDGIDPTEGTVQRGCVVIVSVIRRRCVR